MSARIWATCVAAVALIFAQATQAAPTFGSVIPIGGTPSDIALDQSRGVLYILDFSAHAIDVMSMADNSIHSSLNVLPWPGAMTLSPDGRYLVVAHYCSGITTPGCTPALTSIRLSDNSKQVFVLADSPLGVAFAGNGKAFVVTNSSFLLFDPDAGTTSLLGTIANVSQSLPVPLATFPGQIVQAALAASADGSTVWGIGSAGTSSQLIFHYSSANGALNLAGFTSSPPLLPRISVAADGSYAMVGYTLISYDLYLKGRYPVVIASPNITGNAVDSAHGVIYGEFPDANQSTGPATTLGGGKQSSMVILDSDNLTFRDRISIPENMVGHAVLNSDGSILYAVSESGVMVLPVGSLNAAHRISAVQEDLFFASNFCSSGIVTQNLTITDPGGGHTDFSLKSTQEGVTIFPSSGTTPATVQVRIDTRVIPSSGGTAISAIALSSSTAVNQPKPVRVLVSSPDPSQRGTIVNQPGYLTDILTDSVRNRILVTRQDTNQVLVFDGATLAPVAALRTATSPTMMAIAGNFLLVGHDDSQLVDVFDLTTLKASAPIVLPGGHFGRSVATSYGTILVMARDEGHPGFSAVDSVDFIARTASKMQTLGVYANRADQIQKEAILLGSPLGNNILLATPDGYVALYSSAASTFVASRHDFTSLSGAVAASDYNSYVIGNSTLNSSLVPNGFLSPSPIPVSGFTFTDQGGFMAGAATSGSAGTLMRVSSVPNGTKTSTATKEAGLLSGSAVWDPTGYGVAGSGSNSLYSHMSFTRTIAPQQGTVVVLSTSGLTMLAADYPAASAPASISAVSSAADGSQAIASGGLVSVYGSNLASMAMGASATPLPTLLADSCLAVNGTPVPLMYASPAQINAQIPYNITGSATMTLHTPDGVSNNFLFNVAPTAPSIFLAGGGQPLVVRLDNYELVTPTNPIHKKDSVTIYLNGLGQTTPSVNAGDAAPSSPLAWTSSAPQVVLAGSPLTVTFAGLAPGMVGVYQINATVPTSVVTGLSMPLTINAGGVMSTVNVRVVN